MKIDSTRILRFIYEYPSSQRKFRRLKSKSDIIMRNTLRLKIKISFRLRIFRRSSMRKI